jgi:hypothetical protein
MARNATLLVSGGCILKVKCGTQRAGRGGSTVGTSTHSILWWMVGTCSDGSSSEPSLNSVFQTFRGCRSHGDACSLGSGASCWVVCPRTNVIKCLKKLSIDVFFHSLHDYRRILSKKFCYQCEIAKGLMRIRPQ